MIGGPDPFNIGRAGGGKEGMDMFPRGDIFGWTACCPVVGAVPGVPVAVHFMPEAQIDQIAPVFGGSGEGRDIAIVSAVGDGIEGIGGRQVGLPGEHWDAAVGIDRIAIGCGERGIPIDVDRINRQIFSDLGFKARGIAYAINESADIGTAKRRGCRGGGCGGVH